MSGDDQGPLRRWSERKAKAREQETLPPEPETAAPEEAVESDENLPATVVEELPDIDSLTAESDYTVFMAKGVPEHLKRLALRKLWLSDPVLANVDGLVDYGEDFTVSTLVGDAVKTAYRVGKGFLDEAEEAEELAKEAEELAQEEQSGEHEAAQSDSDVDDETTDEG